MTGNPALNQNTFTDVSAASGSEAMTLGGTVQKTAILLGLTVLSASYTWNLYFSDTTGSAVGAMSGWALVGGLGGFVIAMITIFKNTWSPVTAPLYAVFEGLFIGAISAITQARYGVSVIQAVLLTFGTLAALLCAYQTGMIRASAPFKRGVIAATGGIAIAYFISIILGFFHIQVPFINGSGPLGIGFSVFVVIIAALNLVIDFDFIEQGAKAGAPKYMEWYASFSLLVTLVWLYLEILRLLSKISRRD
jgi:uncharacterized YccA/Bax inhibitor family protein